MLKKHRYTRYGSQVSTKEHDVLCVYIRVLSTTNTPLQQILSGRYITYTIYTIPRSTFTLYWYKLYLVVQYQPRKHESRVAGARWTNLQGIQQSHLLSCHTSSFSFIRTASSEIRDISQSKSYLHPFSWISRRQCFSLPNSRNPSFRKGRQ